MSIELGIQLSTLIAIACAGIAFGVMRNELKAFRERMDEHNMQNRTDIARVGDDIRVIRKDVDEMQIERARLVAIHDMMHKSHSKRLDELEEKIS